MAIDYVLAACCGYPRKVYERFLGSLFDTGYAGAAVLFVRPDDLATVQPLAAAHPGFSVRVMPPGDRQLALQRYDAMREFLREIDAPASARRVLLSDARDVLFQRDWSAHPALAAAADLWVFAEDQTIGNCRFNRAWLDQIDPALAGQLADRRILCSGTTIGTGAGIVAYLDAMAAVAAALQAAGRAGVVGQDQGNHNFLLHTGRLAALRPQALTNDDNLVNTVGYGWKGVDAEGRATNARGDRSWVVHQYDRFDAALAARMQAGWTYDLS
ncbi:MAG: hypothetical protein INH34_02825 [Phycisphaerales bacterium]|jgi:hypothetical protein|nr:hypothetical protein [Phycisphaerales bacterium]